AVFSAAAQTGQRKPTALLEPPCPLRIPRRRFADVESAIAGHQQTLGAVLLQSFFAGDEHRNLCSILRVEEDLLQLVLVRIEWHLGLREQFAFSCLCIDAVDGWRKDEGFKAE